MPEFLALFPLSLVVFPGEILKLHIFEPRYRQLLNDCTEEGITFGIPAVVDRRLSNIATEVTLVSVDKRYSSGEMDITTKGMRRAEIVHFYEKAPGKRYPGGEVNWKTEEETVVDLLLKEDVLDSLEQLNEALGITRDELPEAYHVTAFEIAHQVGLNLAQKVQLLNIDQETGRFKFLAAHLEEILPVVRETERLKAKAKLNGHYKNIVPPQY